MGEFMGEPAGTLKKPNKTGPFALVVRLLDEQQNLRIATDR